MSTYSLSFQQSNSGVFINMKTVYKKGQKIYS